MESEEENDTRGILLPDSRISLRKNAAGAIMLLDGVFLYQQNTE